jgi:anti-sigma B factor antagonist
MGGRRRDQHHAGCPRRDLGWVHRIAVPAACPRERGDRKTRAEIRANSEGSMQIEEKAVGDVMIITVKGDISLNQGGDVLLKDKVRSLLQQGQKKLLLDLGNVSYVDSAGLGQLVQIKVTCSSHAGSLKLLNVTRRLNDLLVLTKLVTVFDCFDTEADALQSF